MKREIKFRAWDGKQMHDHQWVIGRVMNGLCKQKDGDVFKEESISIMQFCGLLDKNGVEIYESDILTSDYGSGKPTKICFGEYKDHTDKDMDMSTSVGFYWSESDETTSRFGKSINGNMDYCQVVGNVFDNPELLQP